MTDRLYEALSESLKDIEAGADVETCLARYPHLANELRPLLDTAAQTRAAALTDVPPDVMRRARARVLDAAAEIRARPTAPFMLRLRWPALRWSARLTRLVFTVLAVLAFMVTGGAGLVSASSGALPGDRLYPVKRGWEGVRLLLTFNQTARQVLEESLENERLYEVTELLYKGRESDIEFYGVVSARTDTGWIINQIIVQVTPQTRIEGVLSLGAYVEVDGRTSASGMVIAERIRVRKEGEGKEEKEEEESQKETLPSGTGNASSASQGASSSSTASPTPAL